MPDDKTNQGSQDDAKVDMNDQNEIRYSCEQFKCTESQLREAISVIGNSREKLKGYFADLSK